MDEIIFWLLIGGIGAILSSPLWVVSGEPKDDDALHLTCLEGEERLNRMWPHEGRDGVEKSWGTK